MARADLQISLGKIKTRPPKLGIHAGKSYVHDITYHFKAARDPLTCVVSMQNTMFDRIWEKRFEILSVKFGRKNFLKMLADLR